MFITHIQAIQVLFPKVFLKQNYVSSMKLTNFFVQDKVKSSDASQTTKLICLTVCEAGTFLHATDNVCVKCRVGSYSTTGAATCTACATGSTTLEDGSTSVEACGNFFLQLNFWVVLQT